MTALYHTQLKARKCMTSAYQIHHNTTETISNPTPGAPDSCGRAPSNENVEIQISKPNLRKYFWKTAFGAMG
jgi:hypothetical protein